jgi:hypothetical protein
MLSGCRNQTGVAPQRPGPRSPVSVHDRRNTFASSASKDWHHPPPETMRLRATNPARIVRMAKTDVSSRGQGELEQSLAAATAAELASQQPRDVKPTDIPSGYW